MADGFKTLNELFINHGVAIEPGQDLEWRTYHIPEEHEKSVMEFVKDQIDTINRETGRSDHADITPMCNPIIQVFQKLEFIVRYFCGEFEIQTENKEFRETFAGIWFQFIKGWYFSNIYVGYGEDFEEIDKQKFIREGKNFYLEGTPGKFRLYSRTDRGTFHSILSGQGGLKFNREQQSRMVKCECGGYYNWLYWWHLWIKWLIGMERFETSVKALSKNVVLTPKTDEELKNISKQFENNECFIKRGGNQDFGTDSTPTIGKTKFDELIFMPRENPMAILEGVQRAFELNAAHLGFAGKIAEQKKERINAGENFPHQKVVSNVRTFLISSLNYVFDQMRIRFPPGVVPDDLKIVPANQTFAQGLPEFGGGAFNQPWGSSFNKFDKFQNNNNFVDKNRGND